MIELPYLIIPKERPAIVRANDISGIPAWAEMQRRERLLREGTFPFPLVPPVSSSAKSIVYTDSVASASDLTTYTFAGRAISTAAADRYVIVGVGGSNSADVSSLTVGGNSATEIIDVADGVSAYAGLWIVNVTTGTTADIVVTFSGGINRCGIGVWAAYGLSSGTPLDSDTSVAAPGSITLTTTAGGIAVSFANGNAGGGSDSWTGVTEDFDISGEASHAFTGGSAATAGASLGITVTYSGTSAEAMVAASF